MPVEFAVFQTITMMTTSVPEDVMHPAPAQFCSAALIGAHVCNGAVQYSAIAVMTCVIVTGTWWPSTASNTSMTSQTGQTSVLTLTTRECAT